MLAAAYQRAAPHDKQTKEGDGTPEDRARARQAKEREQVASVVLARGRARVAAVIDHAVIYSIPNTPPSVKYAMIAGASRCGSLRGL